MSGLIKILIAVFAFSQATSVHAEDDGENGVENLSPEVRSLLSREMLAIQDGMVLILAAYASGNSAEIASIAEKIKNSYILRQDMSREQMHELHEKLPRSFVLLDQKFHNYAGLLEEAANKNSDELVGFYFSKLTEACSGCHSQHARHKFPAFEERSHETAHSH